VTNLLQAEVVIEGVRPFMWHYFGEDAIPLERGEKTGVAGNDPESWKKSVLYTNDDRRRLFIQPTYIYGMLRDGARHTKKGKGSLQPKIQATLQVLDDIIYFDRSLPAENKLKINDYTASIYIDRRMGRNPATKGRMYIYRITATPPWKITFHILWDKTIISSGEMAAILTDSGALEGIGSGRKIGMGRFEVISFTPSEYTSKRVQAGQRKAA
jgi:hypothetical protein